MGSIIKIPKNFIQKFELKQDALNNQLEKLVIEEKNRSEKLAKKEQHSNIGGWQSERDLHAKLDDKTESGKLMLKLFASFSEPMMQYISACCEKNNIKPSGSYDWDYTGAWWNVAVRGSYNAPHTHPQNDISAAYYVRTEEPPEGYPFSGRIDFFTDYGSDQFFPKPGTLFLFPSTMLHFVHPYYGTGLRICLSFNAKNIRPL